MIEKSIEISRLLVVSHDSRLLRLLRTAGESSHWQVEIAADVWDAMNRVQSGVTLDLLLLDLPQGDGGGLQILRTLRRMRAALPVVLIGQPGDGDRKQEALRMGARDYITRSFEYDQLEGIIQHNLSAVTEGAEVDLRSEMSSPRQARDGICGYKSLRSLLQGVKEEAERYAIALALEETGWNRKAAARLLKTSYRTVLYKIEQYQMNSPRNSRLPSNDRSAPKKAGSRDDGGAEIQLSNLTRNAGENHGER